MAEKTSKRTNRKSRPDVDACVDYTSLFEHMPDAVLVWDAQGRYIAANTAALQLTRYSRAAILRKRVGDLTVPKDRRSTDEHLERLRKNGSDVHRSTLLKKNGDRVAVECKAVDLGNATFLASMRAISNRVKAPDEPTRSVEAYRTLLRILRLAVVSADPEGRIASWNSAAELLLGYTAKEVVGQPITIIIPPNQQADHLRAFRSRLASDRPDTSGREIRGVAMRKDGTLIDIDLSIAVDSRGGTPVITAVVRDVHENLRMAEKLNELLQGFQFHIDRMPLAYIVWDINFIAQEWNPAAERIFGFTKKEAIGKHAHDLVIPPDVVPMVDVVWSKLLAGDEVSQFVNENVRKDGTRLTCEWFNTPLRDSTGAIRHVTSMAMDVTEREQIEAQIRNAQRVESLGVLASGVAHDFNSLLMVILGNTTLLRSVPGLPNKAQEYIEPIDEAGLRAGELIKHLLAYARTGRHNPQPANLNAVITEAKNFVVAAIGQEYELSIKLARSLPSVLVDRSQVEQILLNLCLNAKQAMRKNGTVEIQTRKAKLSARQVARCVPQTAKAGTYVALIVTDTGCGMDETTLDHMFDPFFSTKAKGHGLGMAAVFGIVRQHNGMLRVESHPGKGTKIQVFLPPIEDGENVSPE